LDHHPQEGRGVHRPSVITATLHQAIVACFEDEEQPIVVFDASLFKQWVYWRPIVGERWLNDEASFGRQESNLISSCSTLLRERIDWIVDGALQFSLWFSDHYRCMDAKASFGKQ
jgi:hypothetical protein